MISIYRFLIVSVVIGWAINIKAQIKVACVGNSITENIALSNKHKYPSILQDLLGNGYIVRNYGIGARTMLKKGDYPYWNEERYKEVLAWNPDIVIVKMGTNDAKAKNWVYNRGILRFRYYYAAPRTTSAKWTAKFPLARCR